jgi:hypothetical protein
MNKLISFLLILFLSFSLSYGKNNSTKINSECIELYNDAKYYQIKRDNAKKEHNPIYKRWNFLFTKASKNYKNCNNGIISIKMIYKSNPKNID